MRWELWRNPDVRWERYPFVASVKEERLHAGDIVVFDLSDKNKNYFHAINVKKFERE